MKFRISEGKAFAHVIGACISIKAFFSDSRSVVLLFIAWLLPLDWKCNKKQGLSFAIGRSAKFLDNLFLDEWFPLRHWEQRLFFTSIRWLTERLFFEIWMFSWTKGLILIFLRKHCDDLAGFDLNFLVLVRRYYSKLDVSLLFGSCMKLFLKFFFCDLFVDGLLWEIICRLSRR